MLSAFRSPEIVLLDDVSAYFSRAYKQITAAFIWRRRRPVGISVTACNCIIVDIRTSFRVS